MNRKIVFSFLIILTPHQYLSQHKPFFKKPLTFFIESGSRNTHSALRRPFPSAPQGAARAGNWKYSGGFYMCRTQKAFRAAPAPPPRAGQAGLKSAPCGYICR